MEYKGSFIKTILLLFLVLAIVTVLHGRPAGSSDEILKRDVVTDDDVVHLKTITTPPGINTTERTAKTTQVADFEVEKMDDGVEHHHEVTQRCDSCFLGCRDCIEGLEARYERNLCCCYVFLGCCCCASCE